MNKVKPLFRVEIGASEKSADIRKIRDKKNSCHVNNMRQQILKLKKRH